MFRLAYFDPFPPSLDNPVRSLGMRRYAYQPVPLNSLSADDAIGLPRPPWVWVTLGTVFNRDPVVWDRLVEELTDLDLPGRSHGRRRGRAPGLSCGRHTTCSCGPSCRPASCSPGPGVCATRGAGTVWAPSV